MSEPHRLESGAAWGYHIVALHIHAMPEMSSICVEKLPLIKKISCSFTILSYEHVTHVLQI